MIFDMQPELTGETLHLRPLTEQDRAVMTSASSDPLIWALHPARDRHLQEKFQPYFDKLLASRGTLVVINRANGAIIGWSSYGKLRPEAREVEIGWTFLIRTYWGGETNREMKWLMLAHAFTFVDTVVFRVAVDNFRSRAAMEKIGGILIDRPAEIIFEGRPVPHVVYAIGKADFIATLP